MAGIIGYNNNVILNGAGYPIYGVESVGPAPGPSYVVTTGTVRLAPFNSGIPAKDGTYTYSQGVYNSAGQQDCGWFKSGYFPVYALKSNKTFSGYNSYQQFDVNAYYSDGCNYYHQALALPSNAVAVRVSGRLYGSCHYGDTNVYSACNEIYMRLEGGTVVNGNRQATLVHDGRWTHYGDIDVTLSGVADSALKFYCWCSAPTVPNVPTTDTYYKTFCPGQDTQGNITNLTVSVSANG